MPTFLVCRKCQTKEWLQARTPIVHCPTCLSARYAEDEAGKPMILWSELCDPCSWGDAAGEEA